MAGRDEGRGMDELLHHWAADGQLDSSGQFGVDSVRASQLLGQHRLAQPEFFLLKLIQACLAAGSLQLSLKVSSKYLLLEARQLRTSPRQGEAGHYLAAGLAGLLSQQPQEVELSLGIPAESLRWTAGSERWHPFPGRPDDNCFRLVCNGSRPDAAKEKAVVKERCQWAAVPILLHGSLVNLKDWRRKESEAKGIGKPLEVRRGFHLIERYQLDPDLLGQGLAATRLDGPWLDKGGDHVVNSPGTFLRQIRGPFKDGLVKFLRLTTNMPFQRISRNVPACARTLVITAGLQGPSSVQVIKDGVALNPREEDLGIPGCLALLSGQGLSIDLSGFQVIRDDAYQAMVEVVRSELQEMLNEVQQNLKEIRPGRRMHMALGLIYFPLFLVVFGEMAVNAATRGPFEKALRARIQELALSI